MEDTQVGWIAAIIIGGIAGWLAEKIMHSGMGMLMNIVLGIVGAAIAGWLFGLLGVSFGAGWLGYLIAGLIGACILIWASEWCVGRPSSQTQRMVATLKPAPPIVLWALFSTACRWTHPPAEYEGPSRTP